MGGGSILYLASEEEYQTTTTRRKTSRGRQQHTSTEVPKKVLSVCCPDHVDSRQRHTTEEGNARMIKREVGLGRVFFLKSNKKRM